MTARGWPSLATPAAFEQGSAVRQLAFAVIISCAASAAAAQPVAERMPTCMACHGEAGASEIEGVPSLGGQPADYLMLQLYVFRENRRVAAPMNEMVQGLSDEELQEAGLTMAKLPPPPPAGVPLAGAELTEAQGLVARYRCASCHAEGLVGRGQIPRLAGQREEYLAAALTGYKTGTRIGYDPAMNEASQEIRAEHIPLLARYIAGVR